MKLMQPIAALIGCCLSLCVLAALPASHAAEAASIDVTGRTNRTHLYGELQDIEFIQSQMGNGFLQKKITCNLLDQETGNLMARITTDQVFTQSAAGTALMTYIGNSVAQQECLLGQPHHSQILTRLEFFDQALGDEFEAVFGALLHEKTLFCQCHPTFVDEQRAGTCNVLQDGQWQRVFFMDVDPSTDFYEMRVVDDSKSFDRTFELGHCDLNGHSLSEPLVYEAEAK